MTYKHEILPGEPIMLTTMSAEYSVSRDQARSDAEARVLLDNAREPLFCIIDLSRVSFSLTDVIGGANAGARGQEPIFHHNKILELIYVTPNRMVQLAVKGLGSVAFGKVKACVFETIEEALAYVRSQAKN